MVIPPEMEWRLKKRKSETARSDGDLMSISKNLPVEFVTFAGTPSWFLFLPCRLSRDIGWCRTVPWLYLERRDGQDIARFLSLSPEFR